MNNPPKASRALPEQTADTMPPEEAEPLPSKSRSRRARLLAYLVSPQVLVGGVFAYSVTQAVDLYKTFRIELRADVISARESVLKQMIPLPRSSSDTARTIDEVTTLYALYASPEARQVISDAIGTLSSVRSRQVAAETIAAKRRVLGLMHQEIIAKLKLLTDDPSPNMLKSELEASREELQRLEAESVQQEPDARKAGEALDQEIARQEQLLREAQRQIDILAALRLRLS
jgi:hypothetical protein